MFITRNNIYRKSCKAIQMLGLNDAKEQIYKMIMNCPQRKRLKNADIYILSSPIKGGASLCAKNENDCHRVEICGIGDYCGNKQLYIFWYGSSEFMEYFKIAFDV